MNLFFRTVALMCCVSACCPCAHAESREFSAVWQALTTEYCIHCHDADTATRLNLSSIGYDLGEDDSYEHWVTIFDRMSNGEMPPADQEQPPLEMSKPLLAELRTELVERSRARQEAKGRVPARRLSKRELGYTLKDLLRIDADVTANVPEEVDAGGFDTQGVNQRISSIHMESYLSAADAALTHAIRLGENPRRIQVLDFVNNPFLNSFHNKPLQEGGSISRRTERGVALFRDVDYLLVSNAAGVGFELPGRYRIRTQVAAYQSDKAVTLKLIRKEPSGGTHVILVKDLQPGREYCVESEAYFNPGDAFYTTFEMDSEPFTKILAAGGVEHYDGSGIEVISQTCEGPVSEIWPPESTQLLFGDHQIIEQDGDRFQFSKLLLPKRFVRQVVADFASRAFRRPVTEQEIESFSELANAAIAKRKDTASIIRVPLRAILCSPKFLMFSGQPGELDDHALASRLSYFLWGSLPDERLRSLAADGRLTDRAILRQEVERMLDDDKAQRFVQDFVGQWLRLDKINATSPDEGLYPEYDELLDHSLRKETELFVAYLIEKNSAASNLIESDFTFLNRRLAEHYQLEALVGQEFRRVELPPDSVRGGVLTQAAVLKTTANGTTTSPVTRGNFVLTNLLGTPPAPPPPGIGSVEPDTRGKTTIREILAAHRKIESCNQCHREIDPPGFALECFDPIGGYRSHYRATGKPSGLFSIFSAATFHQGPKVDTEGELSNGSKFDDIRVFKQLLLEREEQIVRNLVEKLVVYATGGGIEFADRDEIDSILDKTRETGFPVRDLIHEVVQSRMFRHL